MKNGVCILVNLSMVLAATVGESVAQPVKHWSRLFGGKSADVALSALKYNDTAFAFAGRSSSAELPGTRGVDDFLLGVFTSDGKAELLKKFGGPSVDEARAIEKLPNGLVVMGGYTTAKGGDVSTFYGLTDTWLAAVNPANGSLVWEKTLGGTNNDQLNELFFLETGRLFFAGHTKSIDRDVAMVPTRGLNDIMIGYVNESGELNKIATFGGTKDETAKKILAAEAFGGQMLVFGESSSDDQNFAGLNRGKRDVFILKINRNLNQVLLKTIGGPGDETFADAVRLPGNNYLVFCIVNTSGGQIDSLKGGRDIWVAKINSLGDLLWGKVIGGSKDDVPIAAELLQDGNILLAVNSISNDKDINIQPYGGGTDALLMKLDTNANVLWKKYYGGTEGDAPSALVSDTMGNFYMAASTFSIDFDLDSSNKYPPDVWITRLSECRPYYGDYALEVCYGDTAIVNGRLYYVGNERGVDTLIGQNYLGCDSIVRNSIHFIEAARTLSLDTLCSDSSKFVNGILFDKDHLLDSFMLVSSRGCDSIATLQMTMLEPIGLLDTLIIKDDGTGKGCIGVQLTGGCEPFQYKWSTGAEGTSTICKLFSGFYSLTVTDCHGCPAEFNFFVASTVEADNPLPPTFRTVHTKETLELLFGRDGMYEGEVADLTGRLIFRYSGRGDKFEVDLRSLPSGLYLLRFRQEAGASGQLLFMP
ncbi:MAG: hypothetical protein IT266_10680 [Saprospiraceae bacterium]|nr:hypothetical protein [Saprospiraceae bacterium]